MKNRYLVLSHCAVLGVALGLGSMGSGGGEGSEHDRRPMPRRTKPDLAVSDDAARSLLKEFLQDDSESDRPQFERALETLDGLDENQARIEALLVRLPDYYHPKDGLVHKSPGQHGASSWSEIKGKDGQLIAEFEARIAFWLRADRDACLDFIKTHLKVGGSFQNHPICLTVLPEFLNDGEFSEMVSWAQLHVPHLLEGMFRKEIEEGEGLAVLNTLEDLGVSHSDYLVQSVANKLPFSDREAVLALALGDEESGNGRQDVYILSRFLRNEDHPPGEVMKWLDELIDQDRLPEDFRSNLAREVGNLIKAASSIDYDERVAALEKWDQKSNTPYAELADLDVREALGEGRDLTFEFRHGRLDANEVWEHLTQRLPEMNEEAEKAARINLYRNLAEEDFRKAEVLIDGLPEAEKRKALFLSTTRSFSNVHPQKLLEFSQGLPLPQNDNERRNRIKGWEWKTRPLLRRHGDDYVEWVLKMPPGPDRDEARRGLVWGTMGIDPVQGELLRRKLDENP